MSRREAWVQECHAMAHLGRVESLTRISTDKVIFLPKLAGQTTHLGAPNPDLVPYNPTPLGAQPVMGQQRASLGGLLGWGLGVGIAFALIGRMF